MSIDSYRPNSNPTSRRQSEAKLPSTSVVAKYPHSKSSTPKAANASPVPSPYLSPSKEPPANNFLGLAQSIMTTASSNARYDNSKESAVQTYLDGQRNQRYNAAYHTLTAGADTRYEISDKTKAQFGMHFCVSLEKQNVIATRLDAQITQVSTPAAADPTIISSIDVLKKDMADMRKQIQAAQTAVQSSKDDIEATQAALETQQRKWLRQSDLDRYDRKAVHHDDLAQFVNRQDLLQVETKLTAHDTTLMTSQKKLGDLASVTGVRHRETKDMQERNSSRNESLDNRTRDIEAKQIQAQKTLDAHKNEFISWGEKLDEVRDNLVRLQQVIQGNSESDGTNQVNTAEHSASQVAQTFDTISQLVERVLKLEEAENAGDLRRSTNSPRNLPELCSDLADLRKEFEIFTEAQKGEYDCVVEDMGQLEARIKELQDEAARTKDDKAKQQPQSPLTSTQPPIILQPNQVTNVDGIDRAKLESDLKAIFTQIFVLKKQYDNLTTEHLANNIINQTKQLYKEHPGHVQDKLRMTDTRLYGIDNYITQKLEPRLNDIHMAINGRVTNDAVQALNLRIQVQEDLNKKNCDAAAQSQQHMSNYLDILKKDLMGQKGSEESEQQTINSESMTIMRRLDGLQEDFETLKREVFWRKATDEMKQKSSQQTSETRDRLVMSNGVEQSGDKGKVGKPDGGEPNQNAASQTPVILSPSAHGDSVVGTGDGVMASLANEQLRGLPSGTKRKRKSFATVIDSDDDCEPDAFFPKATRQKGE